MSTPSFLKRKTKNFMANERNANTKEFSQIVPEKLTMLHLRMLR